MIMKLEQNHLMSQSEKKKKKRRRILLSSQRNPARSHGVEDSQYPRRNKKPPFRGGGSISTYISRKPITSRFDLIPSMPLNFLLRSVVTPSIATEFDRIQRGKQERRKQKKKRIREEGVWVDIEDGKTQRHGRDSNELEIEKARWWSRIFLSFLEKLSISSAHPSSSPSLSLFFQFFHELERRKIQR